MQVLGILYSMPDYTPQVNYKRLYPNLSPLKADTVCFGALKKNKFEGLEFAVVEKYKAPIEKFNSHEDFDRWAIDKSLQLCDKSLLGKSGGISSARQEEINEWKNHVLGGDIYTPAMQLIIIDGITKDLKENNDNISPSLNKEVLADTMRDLESELRENSKQGFDFGKKYKQKLYKALCPEIDEVERSSFWLKIPSKKHDEVNFETNINKLKTFSRNNWCTRSMQTREYLSEGDFHIYIENGKPKIGIRLTDDKVTEIQGEKNNSLIPLAYLDMVKDYIEESELVLDEDSEEKISKAENLRELLKKLDGLKEIKTNEDKIKVFDTVNIDAKEDEDGKLIISEYRQPEIFKDVGIDEDKLFENVKEITGGALFEKSSLTELKNLEKIGVVADFTNSQIKKLGKLKYIGDSAYFTNSKVEDLGDLEYIGGDVIFTKSQVKSLNKLKYVGGYIDVMDSQVNDLGELETVAGDIYCDDEQIDMFYEKGFDI